MPTLLPIVVCALLAAIDGAPSPRFAITPPALTTTATWGDEKPIVALEAWLRLYRTGKIDFRSPQDIGKDSLAAKYGLTPKNAVGTATWAGDLDRILEAVAKLDSADAADALLEVASIGFESVKSPLLHAPLEVRAAGERWLAQLTSDAAHAQLTRAARGELKVEKNRALATRLAAVRGIGRMRDARHRPLLEQLIGDGEEQLRALAAAALARFGDEAAAKLLIAQLEKETSELALTSLAEGLLAVYFPETAPRDEDLQKPAAGGAAAPAPTPAPAPTEGAAAKPLPESARLAGPVAAAALGRASWRADMQLIRLLDRLRPTEAIPALIAVLDRFVTKPEDVKAGKTSGLVQAQAHETLVGMTGATIPANQPAQWTAFWTAERDRLKVRPHGEKPPEGGTSAGTFFGIPVQGTRVVFVLDLSGSMMWRMEGKTTDKNRALFRLDFAKRELHNAADALAANATFNLITFNGEPKPESWSKDLVPATPQNRERFKKYVDGLRAEGGTNLWSGVDEALKIRTVVQGNRYGANIDELFVLSDGAPNVGEVIDPLEILRVVHETNRFAKVRINTVFISSDAPEAVREQEAKMSLPPAALMRKLAEQNGGAFREL